MILGPGIVAPDFALPNQFGQTVRLGDFCGIRAVTLVFFPLAFSRTCEGELCELRDNIEIFADSGSELIAVSVDSKHALRAWAEEQRYEFTLLADFWPHGAVAKAYGVFNDDAGFANRGTFLVDVDGIVRFSEMNGPGEGRDPQAWREAIKELRAR